MSITSDNGYIPNMSNDKTDPPPVIRDLTHYNIQNDYIERKQLLYRGIEKILQNEENILMINEIFENKKINLEY
jgi:hypothetical protein